MLRRTLAALSAAAVVCAGASQVAVASPETPGLPLGDPDLPQSKTTSTLATGVTWSRIVRGDKPANEDDIGTTDQGPWVVNVLKIDPRKARGRLEATYGPDLARSETVSSLVGHRRGLVGTNASFFTYTANADYPGDPVGLGVYGGRLHSEPASSEPAEQDVLVNAGTGKLTFGHHSWTGEAVNPRTGSRLPVDAINHPPAVPEGCTTDAACEVPGDTTWITRKFASNTPAGSGAEVVLGPKGCVLRTNSTTRGTGLAPGQTALQATGADAKALIAHAQSRACFSLKQRLLDESGRPVSLTANTFGVNGRYRLTAAGKVVVPPGSGSFFERNPRTVIGRTADDKIALVTLDGRMTTSVGTTMNETAAVANALGLVDAVNLDGGGSTTLANSSGPLNTPSSGAQRPVGDALVWVPTRSR